MKQKVQLARALAADSKVILMDEPFGALDAITAEQMEAELLRIWKRAEPAGNGRSASRTMFYSES